MAAVVPDSGAGCQLRGEPRRAHGGCRSSGGGGQAPDRGRAARGQAGQKPRPTRLAPTPRLPARGLSVHSLTQCPPTFTLSVIVPVFNERLTVRKLIERVRAVPIRKEIIIVDDGSTDGTADVIRALAAEPADPDNRVRAIFHAQNAGKGAAIRTAIPAVTGDIALIQDADLEYDPAEYPSLIQPILDGHADVVFGSRFLGGAAPRALLPPHRSATGC